MACKRFREVFCDEVAEKAMNHQTIVVELAMAKKKLRFWQKFWDDANDVDDISDVWSFCSFCKTPFPSVEDFHSRGCHYEDPDQGVPCEVIGCDRDGCNGVGGPDTLQYCDYECEMEFCPVHLTERDGKLSCAKCDHAQ